MGWLDELLGGTTRSAVAGGIGAPVDAAALGLNALIAGGGYAGHKLGLLSEPPRMIENPVGGSEWIAGKMRGMGLLNDTPGSTADNWGNALGSVLVPLTAAKAPQIARGLLQGEANLAAPRKMNPQTGAIVWHGSPHKFDKFDSSKIGTGEGAQAYGHGLYLAESPKVADEYASKLSKPIVDFSGKIPSDPVEIAIQQKLQSLAETTQTGARFDQISKVFNSYLNPTLTRWDPKHPKANAYNKMAPIEGEELERVIAVRDAAKRLGRPDLGDSGSLYKVDLPDEHIAKMLDWDKPLSQQHPEVQKMLEPLGYSSKAQVSQYEDDLLAALSGDASVPLKQIRDPMGSDIARGGGVFDSKAQIEKAKRLRELGIPGIRYLDGGSRGAGSGTSNYVVFPGNEGLLKILERNGQIIP